MAERPSMSPASARTAGLVLLAGALGALAGSQWSRRGPLDAPRTSAPQPPVIAAGLGPVTSLDPLLSDAAPAPHDVRNPFHYAESPEERAARLEKGRLDAIEARKREQESIDRKRLEEELLAALIEWDRQHPDPPAVTLQLIGKMGTAKAPLAILATADGDVLSVRPGEVVAGKFELLDLGFETATIGYTNALVAGHPEWKSRRTVLRMGAR